MYQDKEFADEKSTQRIEKKTSLYEEANSQNIPSIFEKYADLNKLETGVITARKQNNIDRKQQLEQFKAKFIDRDGEKAVTNNIANMQQTAGRG